jgi:hypothetical protein
MAIAADTVIQHVRELVGDTSPTPRWDDARVYAAADLAFNYILTHRPDASEQPFVDIPDLSDHPAFDPFPILVAFEHALEMEASANLLYTRASDESLRDQAADFHSQVDKILMPALTKGK